MFDSKSISTPSEIMEQILRVIKNLKNKIPCNPQVEVLHFYYMHNWHPEERQ